MKKSGLIFSLLFFCLSMFWATSASATFIYGSSSNVSLNGGVFADGTNSAAPNLFSTPELIKNQGNETKTGTVAFSAIPLFDFSSTLYFQFIYDQQETKNSNASRQVNIDSINISVVSGTIWTLSEPIILNNYILPNDYTDTPLSAGGDMALFVPVSLFTGLNLKGNDILTFQVTQSLSDNGGDEWIVQKYGSFFDPEDSIVPGELPAPTVPTPEPATMLLLGTGLVGVASFARRKKKKLM